MTWEFVARTGDIVAMVLLAVGAIGIASHKAAVAVTGVVGYIIFGAFYAVSWGFVRGVGGALACVAFEFIGFCLMMMFGVIGGGSVHPAD